MPSAACCSATSRKNTKSKATRSSKKSTPSCHKPNAANAASPAANPTPQAIAKGEADINQCPPGGQEGVEKLAELLGVEPKPLNADNGAETPPQVAFIIEDWCIGCTKCIKACPVDAILGSNQKMHTIISDECTGCRLCVDPCPVNCIIMKPRDQKWNWDKPQDPNHPT